MFIQLIVIASVAGVNTAISCNMVMSENYATVDYTCTAANVNINQPNTSLIISSNNHPGQSFNEITAFKVSNQKMIYLPLIFNELKNIRVLNIERSLQKYLLKNDLQSSRQLLELSLSYGEIEDINEDTFENTFNLLYISIEHHRISNIPSKLFKNLDLLKYVSFRNNLLNTLSENLFLKNHLLENIYFDNNNLTTIGEFLFQNQKQVKKISFLNNHCINKEFPETSLVELENVFHNHCKEGQEEYLKNLRQKNKELDARVLVWESLEQKNLELEANLLKQLKENQILKIIMQKCESNNQLYETKVNKLNGEKLQLFDDLNEKINKILQVQNIVANLQSRVKTLGEKNLNSTTQATEADNNYNKCRRDNEVEVLKVTDLSSQILKLKQNNEMIINKQNLETTTTLENQNLKLEIESLRKELQKRSFGFKCFNQD